MHLAQSGSRGGSFPAFGLLSANGNRILPTTAVLSMLLVDGNFADVDARTMDAVTL